MQLPGAPSLLFLFYVLLFLPWASFSRRKKQAMRKATTEGLSDGMLERIWLSTIMGLGILFFLAWLVGSGFGFQIFKQPRWDVQTFSAIVVGLGLCLVVREVVKRSRSHEDRRKLVVFALAARTTRQWVLKWTTALAAGISEEAAYRGVGWAILIYMTDNVWLSAVGINIAFTLVHNMQGRASMVAIFVIGMLMHGVVWMTDSLVPAMIVHTVYDWIALTLISFEAKKLGLPRDGGVETAVVES